MHLSDRVRFEQAVNVISTRIKLVLMQLPSSVSDSIQEIRLRVNKPVIIVDTNGSSFITDRGKLTKIYSDNCVTVSSQEIADTLNRACNYSIHSFQQNINNGFVTVDGGHRIGVAGTAVFLPEGGFNVKDVLFLNIRIARQVFGVSKNITEKLFKEKPESIIIAGPPSSGKTTFLRDFAYNISSDFFGKTVKTTVIDERGELSAPHLGTPQNDLGVNTDVLINYKKSDAVEIAIRSLSPEYIIFDEICSENDLTAIKTGLNSGVKFAVSVHCGDSSELKEKRIIKELINTNSFTYTILLSNVPKPGTVKGIYKTEIYNNEIIWTDINTSLFFTLGSVNSFTNEKQDSLFTESSSSD